MISGILPVHRMKRLAGLMRSETKVKEILLALVPSFLVLVACSTSAGDAGDNRFEARPTGIVDANGEDALESTMEDASPATINTPTGTPMPQSTSTTQSIGQPEGTASDPSLTYQSMILIDGSELAFAMILPENFNPTQPYPVLLALPPGPQTRAMVDAGLDGYWLSGATGRDWIIISPIAPDGLLFFRGSESLLPEFLLKISEQFSVEGGKFHLAGISNGGISAFRIATLHSELFHSIVVLPGYPVDQDFSKLDRLAGIPVRMYVGEFDTDWVQEMGKTQQELESLNANSRLEIVAGSGHVITRITGEELFDLLETFR